MSDPVWQRFYPQDTFANFVATPQRVSDMFIELVARYGDKIALDYRDHDISYAQLGAMAGRAANALRAQGIGRGHTVALYLPNTPFHPIYFFATLLVGARVCHLSPLDVFDELHFKCRDSEAAVLITLSSQPFSHVASRLKDANAVARVVLCDEEGLIAQSLLQDATAKREGVMREEDFLAGVTDDLIADPGGIDDIALLQYTGGTTGQPKAAIHTHATLSAAIKSYLHWFARDPNSGPEAVVLVVLPLFHVMALVALLLRRLCEGARLVIHQRFDVEKVLSDIASKRITAFSGVPTMWIALLNHPKIAHYDLSSLQRISSGGAPLPIEIYDRVEALTGLGLRGGWGMTETAATGSNVPIIRPDGKEGTVGIPLPGVTIQIVARDDPSQILPPGQHGEIRVKAGNVSIGYWNHPEETKAAFCDGFLLTGDIGFMDEDGFLYIVDRKKDLIISGGFNIYPQPIENAIIEHPCVAEVMVIGVADDYLGEAAKAFIVLKRHCESFTLDDLRAFLTERLGRHEMPRQLAFVSELPKTSVGKYSRQLLRKQIGSLAT